MAVLLVSVAMRLVANPLPTFFSPNDMVTVSPGSIEALVQFSDTIENAFEIMTGTAFVTTMKPDSVWLFTPAGPEVVSVTLLVPTAGYVNVKFVAVVLVVIPFPKSQNRFVIVPVEKSLKLTVSGAWPLVGVAEK